MADVEEAKEKFEKEREQVLKSLPDNVKDMFKVMGFCKAEVDEDDENAANLPDVWIPCLVLSPYDVPPRPVRDVYWWDTYSKSKRTKKLKSLEYLVYHYGAEDPDDCYSFIAQDEFKPYDTGIAEGCDKLPANIQSKVDAGEELTEEEEIRVRGLKEMLEDAEKAPEDRFRGNWEFKERHEVMADKKATGPSPAKRQKRK